HGPDCHGRRGAKMSTESTTSLSGPDFTLGIELSEIPEEGMVLGNAHGQGVLLIRHRGEISAVGATCTHYGAPLADGLVSDGTLRCPWHHACFNARTGALEGPPALNDLPCWKVERVGSKIVVGEPLRAAPKAAPERAPTSVVIIGAGAAGNSAAETLRGEG